LEQEKEGGRWNGEYTEEKEIAPNNKSRRETVHSQNTSRLVHPKGKERQFRDFHDVLSPLNAMRSLSLSLSFALPVSQPPAFALITVSTVF